MPTFRIPGPIGVYPEVHRHTGLKELVHDRHWLRPKRDLYVRQQTGLPLPWKQDGVAVDGNFAGPGWNGEFRTRPKDDHDLAAKLHDAAYELNELNVMFTTSADAARRRGKEKQSRKAKADKMYRAMTNLAQEKGYSQRYLVDLVARAIFDGVADKEYDHDDGYVNVLHPEWLSQLANPDCYLMIPYSALKDGPRLPKREPSMVKRGQQATVLPAEEDYLAAATEDSNPGFIAWIRNRYDDVWNDLQNL
jgi:hypothetical protein